VVRSGVEPADLDGEGDGEDARCHDTPETAAFLERNNPGTSAGS
jgi:hypothetical protein